MNHRWVPSQETCIKAVFSQYNEVPKIRNTRDHLAWTIGKGDPMHEVCIPHSIHTSRSIFRALYNVQEEEAGTRIIVKQ